MPAPLTAKRRNQLAGHAAMLAFSGLVAGSFSLGTQVANEIAPSAVNWARFFLAGLIVAGVVLAQGSFRREHFHAPWRYLVLGTLFAAYFVLMFEGLKSAPPVSAAAVFTLMPIMSAGFGWLLLRQVTTPRMAAGLAIGAAGALWVIFRADVGRMIAFDVGRGEFVYFLGCICHAAYTPMIPKLNRGEPAAVMTLGMIIAGFAVLTVYGWSDIVVTDWTALRPLVWVTIVYLAVFASAATFLLLQFASLRLPAAKVMAYSYLTPTWVIAWEVAQAHDTPPLLVLAGIGATVIALLLLLRDEEAR